MPKIVSRERWLEQRRALLERERAFSKERDALAAARRDLPWVRVEMSYEFETSNGSRSLDGLFEGRSQLIVYHFMFGPDAASPCKSCSFWADNFDRAVPHLAARDVTLAAISRAPLARLDAMKARMGWTFPWHSSGGSDFNYDFGVSFRPEEIAAGGGAYNYGKQRFRGADAPGLSVFKRDGKGGVFHTYSTFARGLDALNGTYQLLDLVPDGRGEDALDWPMQWVRLRDEYACG
jgi:predicted dithiol-disulfide oxidoreductase (DUF899 family)